MQVKLKGKKEIRAFSVKLEEVLKGLQADADKARSY
jgi:hypothetical protein